MSKYNPNWSESHKGKHMIYFVSVFLASIIISSKEERLLDITGQAVDQFSAQTLCKLTVYGSRLAKPNENVIMLVTF